MNEKRKLALIWGSVLIGFILISYFPYAFSEPITGGSASRVVQTEGDRRYIATVPIDSHTAVSPFKDIAFSNGETGQTDELISVLVQNPNSYDVGIGTWSGMDISTGPFVPKSSGSYTTMNHATFYMMAPAGASSGTVRFEADISQPLPTNR